MSSEVLFSSLACLIVQWTPFTHLQMSLHTVHSGWSRKRQVTTDSSKMQHKAKNIS